MIHALPGSGVNKLGNGLQMLDCTVSVFSFNCFVKFPDSGPNLAPDGAVANAPFFALSVSFGCRALTCQLDASILVTDDSIESYQIHHQVSRSIESTHSLSKRLFNGPTRHYFIRMGTAVMLLTVSSLLLLWDIFLKATSALLRPLSRRYLRARVSSMAARLMRLARFYGGLRVELDPRLRANLPDPCLVCANHQSVADIAILLAAFRSHQLRFVAKRELARGFPAVSEVLRIQRHALIDRGGYRNTALALETLGRRARSGMSPVVFPEGTRSRDGNLKTFHTGGVRTILERTKLSIVGVAIDGGQYFARMSNLLGGLSGITYRVAYVGTFDPGTNKEETVEAVQNVHLAIGNQLDAWRDHSGRNP